MDIKTTILFIVAVTTSYLSLFILHGKNDKTNVSFSFFIFFISIWSLFLGFFLWSSNLVYAYYYTKVYYIAAAAIPFFFLIFSVEYTKFKKLNKRILFSSSIAFFALSATIIFKKGFLIQKVYYISEQNNIKGVDINLPGYYTYILYFVSIFTIAYLISLITLFKTKDITERNGLRLLVIGTFIPFLFGMWFDLILPMFDYTHIWAGPPFAFVVIWVVLYTIQKYKLFNIKLLAVEVIVASLWLFILFRSLIRDNLQDKVIDFALLFIILVVGYILVRSVKKEVDAREKIETLAKELETANAHLQVLDQQKSEFVSLASHQLRGPLTAIKGYTSMVIDGDFGEISDTVKDALQKVFKSTQDLVILVNDYLDVSRIEQGRMQYNFESFDMSELLTTLVNELKPNIDPAKLTLETHIDGTQMVGAQTAVAGTGTNPNQYYISGDKNKIKQVLGNLIDNATKYTPQGKISIWLTRKQNHKVLFSVSDTGVGISKDVLPRLFEKFTRAPDASKTNIIGTGLGLYVAKKMVEAHHGRIWAESAGLGKGSTFFVELDASR